MESDANRLNTFNMNLNSGTVNVCKFLFYVVGEALEDGAGSTDDDKNVEKMEEMDPSPQRVAVHFRTVSTKVRERMFKRAMRDFRSAKVRTMDVIGKLHNTVDLVCIVTIWLGTVYFFFFFQT